MLAEFEIARLVAVLGRVDGRKRLQKIVHLLGMAGFPEFSQRFVLHYFGPFSRELAAQLDFVCAAGLVDEGPPPDGEGNYVYQSPQIGEGSMIKNLLSEEATTSSRWRALAEELNKQKTPFLEALSTLVFLSNAGFSGRRLEEEFGCVKPALRRHYDNALNFAKKKDLVKPK